MTKHKRKGIKFLFIILPLIIAIGVYMFSTYLFEQNRIQSYEHFQQEKEDEIRSIVRAVDNLVELTASKELTEEQRKIIQLNIQGINSAEGVHCFLLDKEFNHISNYSDDMTELDNHVLYTLRNLDNIKELIQQNDNGDNSDNYIRVNIEKHGEYEFYWQRVPTENTEYYIIVGVSLEAVKPNEAVIISKALIGVLNMILAVSMYANIYMYKKANDDEN